MYKPFERYMPPLVVCYCTDKNHNIDLSKFGCCRTNYTLNDLISVDALFGSSDQMNDCTRYSVKYRTINPTTYQYVITDNYLGITKTIDQHKLDTKDLPEDSFLQLLNFSGIVDNQMNLAQLYMFAELFDQSGINKNENSFEVYSDKRKVCTVDYSVEWGIGFNGNSVPYENDISVYTPEQNTELLRFFKRLEKQGVIFERVGYSFNRNLTTIEIFGRKEITSHAILCVSITLIDLELDKELFDTYAQLLVTPQLNVCP